MWQLHISCNVSGIQNGAEKRHLLTLILYGSSYNKQNTIHNKLQNGYKYNIQCIINRYQFSDISSEVQLVFWAIRSSNNLFFPILRLQITTSDETTSETFDHNTDRRLTKKKHAKRCRFLQRYYSHLFCFHTKLQT